MPGVERRDIIFILFFLACYEKVASRIIEQQHASQRQLPALISNTLSATLAGLSRGAPARAIIIAILPLAAVLAVICATSRALLQLRVIRDRWRIYSHAPRLLPRH